MDKLVVYVPEDAAAPLRAAHRRGRRRRASATTTTARSPARARAGSGRSRAPTRRSAPSATSRWSTSTGSSACCRAARARPWSAALLAAHPYEEPAFDVIEMADPGTSATAAPAGSGPSRRPRSRSSPRRVAAALPATAHGVRVAGAPSRAVRRVAVCGGAGDFLLDRWPAQDVDVYLTSDLRHHPAAEFAEKGGPALVDVAHWAAEWTWLPVVQARLTEALGDTVESRVSTHRAPTPGPSGLRRTAPEEHPLKADPFAQLKLLDVQELDSRIDQLRHQLASLPEHARDRRAAGRAHPPRRPVARRPDPGRRPRPRAAQGRTPTSSRSRPAASATSNRMDQGLITNPKDLERMGDELESLERRISSLEDVEIEVMEKLEEAQGDLDSHRRRARRRPTSSSPTRRTARDARPSRSTRASPRRPPSVPPRPRAARRPAGALRQAPRVQEGRRRRGRAAGPRCSGCQITHQPRPTWP